jgi:hypothetical protein
MHQTDSALSQTGYSIPGSEAAAESGRVGGYLLSVTWVGLGTASTDKGCECPSCQSKTAILCILRSLDGFSTLAQLNMCMNLNTRRAVLDKGLLNRSQQVRVVRTGKRGYTGGGRTSASTMIPVGCTPFAMNKVYNATTDSKRRAIRRTRRAALCSMEGTVMVLLLVVAMLVLVCAGKKSRRSSDCKQVSADLDGNVGLRAIEAELLEDSKCAS